MTAPADLRAVLFDWDGTLIDSAELSYRCYARAFAVFGIRFDRDDFARTYSPDWHRTYRALGLPEASWPRCDTLWLEHYETDAAPLLPGAESVLRRLDAAGLRLGVVSSGDGRRVRRELEAFGLTPLFGAVVCGGDTANRKPHPEPLVAALDRLEVRPEQAAYVGDSPEDVAMARAAGVFAVGIPGGFPNRGALAAAAPDLVLDDVGAVPAWAVDGARPVTGG